MCTYISDMRRSVSMYCIEGLADFQTSSPNISDVEANIWLYCFQDSGTLSNIVSPHLRCLGIWHLGFKNIFLNCPASQILENETGHNSSKLMGSYLQSPPTSQMWK